MFLTWGSYGGSNPRPLACHEGQALPLTSIYTAWSAKRPLESNAGRRRTTTANADLLPNALPAVPGNRTPSPRRSDPLGPARQLCHTARPGRPHWPGDLTTSHSDGPPGPLHPGPDTPESA